MEEFITEKLRTSVVYIPPLQVLNADIFFLIDWLPKQGLTAQSVHYLVKFREGRRELVVYFLKD